jgi:predicted transcriptional regulator
MSRENSERFLAAFSAIEKALRKLVGVNRAEPFSSVVNKAAKRSGVVRAFEYDLKEYGDLRNAIVHERVNDQPIAEPHPQIVQHLERIRTAILAPPRIEQGFLKPVEICSPNDPIGKPARTMLQGAFSQVPVYAEGRLIGLLTSETIARWLGAMLAEGIGLLEEARAETVLQYTEDHDHYQLVSRQRPVVDVIEMFEEYTKRGKSLDAVIITQTGSREETPLGILTIFDLPQLYALVGLKVSTEPVR